MSAGTPAGPPPVRRLTVLYDDACPMCRRAAGWLSRQPQIVPVDTLAAASPRARNRYPDLDHEATLREVTVVGDSGQVWTGARAWIVVLWALRHHRTRARHLATPAGLPLAWAAVRAAAGIRAVTRAPGRPDPFAAPGEAAVCAGGCPLGAH